ncbi:MAG: GIY-YIG nuclease family protein, partial [Desulfovibrionaceae bacterium]|nr:GIY-YIG nuclease family protein [Desulfovibrionaceae bacterium]
MTAEDRAAGAGGWLVYLVRCSDGSLYCGCTTDMNRRLAQHNGLLAGGARF